MISCPACRTNLTVIDVDNGSCPICGCELRREMFSDQTVDSNQTVDMSRLESTALPHEVPKPAKGKPVTPQQSDMFASLPHPVLDELAKLDLDNMTPRRALEMLYTLKTRI